MKRTALLLSLLLAPFPAFVQVPPNLVAENIPPFPGTLVDNVRPYLEFRTAGLSAWNPARHEILVLARFAEVPQLHSAKSPGGARTQLTFFPDTFLRAARGFLASPRCASLPCCRAI